MMDTCEAFLNAYRDLEEVLGVKYGQKTGTVQIFASREGERYFEELNLFREMRNLLSHHGRVDGQHAVLPSEASLAKILEILDFAKNPPIALSIATKKESLMCAGFGDSLDRILNVMEKRGYSHIPVLGKGDSLFGVFSVGTLFAFAKANPDRAIKGLTIGDVTEFLPVGKHTTEKFDFVCPDAGLWDIKEKFRLSGPYHRRTVALFVTDKGRDNGKLLGMITPWDVFRAEEGK
ncbi:MAG: CBS domain-containing protein [Clostridia bacterium]|nr:CBS domain-containing protein [Clostridia bacterium]